MANIFCQPLVGRIIGIFTNQTINRNGVSYRLRSPYISNTIKASIFWNFYERAEIAFVRKYLNNRLPVVELGGSIGIVSSVIGKCISPQRLIIVEANPTFASIIEEQLRLNEVENYQILSLGIGHGEKLYFEPGLNNTVGCLTPIKTSQSQAIPISTLTQVLEANQISRFALVSDIEGSEVSFLFDAPEALDNCEQMIIELHAAEYNGQFLSVNEQIAQIERIGFQIVDQHGPVVVARR